MINWKVAIDDGFSGVGKKEVDLASRVAAEVWLMLGANEEVGLESIDATFFKRDGVNHAQFTIALTPEAKGEQFGKIWITGVLGLFHALSDDRISNYVQTLVLYQDDKPRGTLKLHTNGNEYVCPAVIAENLVAGIKSVLRLFGQEIVRKGKTLKEIADSLDTNSDCIFYPSGKYRLVEEGCTPSRESRGDL